MSDPAEDVPSDRHLGQRQGDFEYGALGPGVTRAGGIGTVVELADQLHRTVQRVEPAIPVIADVHPPSTDRAVPVKNVEFPQREVRVRRPSVSHPAYLRDHDRPLIPEVCPDVTSGTHDFLALCRTVAFKGHRAADTARARD